MIFKKISYRILITIYAIIVLLFALIAFTYAYFHDAKNIDFYQIYSSSEIDVIVESIPAATKLNIEFFKSPISKISDVNYDNFNNDVIVLDIIVTNNSLFSVKTSMELINLVNNHHSMVYWIGIDLVSNNFKELILEDIKNQNLNDFKTLVDSLSLANSTCLRDLKNRELLPQESIQISIVFWMEWDQLPESLNIDFNYLLKISSLQFNGDW